MRASRLVLATVAVLGLLFAVSVIAEPMMAQDMVVLPTTSTEQRCPATDSVEYTWFIYNDLGSSYLVQATVVPSDGTGWSSELDSPVAVLDDGGSIYVTLTVHADADVSNKVVNQTIRFVFSDLSGANLPIERTKYANTSLISEWGSVAAGKNKLLGSFDNPLPSPFNDNYVTFFISIGIWALVALLFAYVVDPAAKLVTRRTKSDIDDRIMKIVRVPLFVIIIIYGVVSSFSILPLGEHEVGTIYRVYGMVLIIVLTFVVYKLFREVLIYMGKRFSQRTSTEIDDVLIPVIDKIGGVVILVFGAVAVVSYLGYDITFLLAGVGVAGLVIAFAAQDALSNFFSGIFLLLDRPFAEGDIIQLTSGEFCRVEKIGLRSTRLYDVFQNNYVILPNNKLINDKIVNQEEPDERGKTSLTVGVAYGTDVEKVEDILMETALAHPNVLKETGKQPVVRFTEFGDSSLNFALYVWVDDFMNQWRVAHELRKAVNKRFAEDGIEIPFPQRTVYIKEMAKAK
jgi:MscS family membrane protein